MEKTAIEKFMEEREKLNGYVMKYADNTIKRFFSLDNQTYREGTLDKKTKEMLGFVASLVLRCEDCIDYHLGRCHEEGVTDAEFAEMVSVGMIVGGSITVPHMRRAFKKWDELRNCVEK